MAVASETLTPEFFSRMQGKAFETFSILTDMNHKVLQGLVGLSAVTAKEGLRTAAELQAATVDAARSFQPSAGPEGLEDLGRNPFAWYQRSWLAFVEGTQKACRIVEANAQAVTRSTERIQASADQTGQEIQEVVTTSVARLKDVYARS